MRFDEHFLNGALADAVILDNHFPEQVCCFSRHAHASGG